MCQLLERIRPSSMVPTQRRLAMRVFGDGQRCVQRRRAIRVFRRSPHPPSRAAVDETEQEIGLGVTAVAPAWKQSENRCRIQTQSKRIFWTEVTNQTRRNTTRRITTWRLNGQLKRILIPDHKWNSREILKSFHQNFPEQNTRFSISTRLKTKISRRGRARQVPRSRACLR